MQSHDDTTRYHGITVTWLKPWKQSWNVFVPLIFLVKTHVLYAKDQHRITTVWLDLALNWLIGGSFTRTSNKPKPTPVITMEWENHRLCPPVLQIVATANCCKAHWARTSGSHINWIERSAGAITLPIQCHYALLYIYVCMYLFIYLLSMCSFILHLFLDGWPTSIILSSRENWCINHRTMSILGRFVESRKSA